MRIRQAEVGNRSRLDRIIKNRIGNKIPSETDFDGKHSFVLLKIRSD